MTLDAIGALFKKIAICKGSSFACCNKYNDDDKLDTISHSDSLTPENLENIYNFDREYVLSKYPVTTDFFELDDIGKFVTDIDGFCVFLNEKTAEMLGEKRKKIRFNQMWSFNVFREDILEIINKWEVSLLEEKPLFYKERRIVNNKIIYLIFEAYPVISRGRSKGLKGIILRVPKQVWTRFDVKKAIRILLETDFNLCDSPAASTQIKSIHSQRK